MAHFAQLDENNLVLQVIVVHNNELIGPDGLESEQKGVEFCQSLFGIDTAWKQTSYSKKFRKNYASVGFTYDAVLDAFVPPSPYPSWVLNTDNAQWDPPIPYPTDGGRYKWDESSQSWVLVVLDESGMPI